MTDTTLGNSSAGNRRAPTLFERLVTRIGNRMLPDSLAGSVRISLPSGARVRIAGKMPGPEADLWIHSWRVLWRCILAGGNGFAESYIRDEAGTTDLVDLVRFFARNKTAMTRSGGRLFRSRKYDRQRHLRRANTRAVSRRNIADHYDLSNEFFALWLDETMTYSAALYADDGQSLIDAQRHKYRRIYELLELQETGSILEIGCGWGGFAAEILPGTSHDYLGITLSREQLKYARQRGLAGMGGAREFKYLDYRDTEGQYDGIVSIEMVEAVGEEYWPEYFTTVADRLKPGAHAVVQSITIAPEFFETYRQKADFIQRYIFPGGMLPTLDVLRQHAAEAGLATEVMHTVPSDYARTLACWRETFEQRWPEIAALGFDERFRRMWRYYLSYCEAAFTEEVIGVSIIRFSKPPA